MNFDFQNINDGNREQQEDEHGDPLHFLIELNTILETFCRINQLRNLQLTIWHKITNTLDFLSITLTKFDKWTSCRSPSTIVLLLPDKMPPFRVISVNAVPVTSEAYAHFKRCCSTDTSLFCVDWKEKFSNDRINITLVNNEKCVNEISPSTSQSVLVLLHFSHSIPCPWSKICLCVAPVKHCFEA